MGYQEGQIVLPLGNTPRYRGRADRDRHIERSVGSRKSSRTGRYLKCQVLNICREVRFKAQKNSIERITHEYMNLGF